MGCSPSKVFTEKTGPQIPAVECRHDRYHPPAQREALSSAAWPLEPCTKSATAIRFSRVALFTCSRPSDSRACTQIASVNTVSFTFRCSSSASNSNSAMTQYTRCTCAGSAPPETLAGGHGPALRSRCPIHWRVRFRVRDQQCRSRDQSDTGARDAEPRECWIHGIPTSDSLGERVT